MTRLSDAFEDRFPDHSPEPSARRAYYAGVAEMRAIVFGALHNGGQIMLDNRLMALEAILDTVAAECDSQGVR